MRKTAAIITNHAIAFSHDLGHYWSTARCAFHVQFRGENGGITGIAATIRV
jgi:hypothetical protein